MPSLTVARLTQGQVSGAGLFGNVGAALGIGGSGAAALSITLSDVVSVQLDLIDAYKVLQGVQKEFAREHLLPHQMISILQQSRSSLLGPYCRLDPEALRAAGAFVVIANEVMYAHALDYEFHNESAFAARAAADLAGVFPQRAGGPRVPSFASAAQGTSVGEPRSASGGQRGGGSSSGATGGAADGSAADTQTRQGAERRGTPLAGGEGDAESCRQADGHGGRAERPRGGQPLGAGRAGLAGRRDLRRTAAAKASRQADGSGFRQPVLVRVARDHGRRFGRGD